MIRALLFVALTLVDRPGLAADIPVTGVFGSSEEACDAYAEGGTKSIVSGNGAVGLIVGPYELVGLEWGCRADAVFGTSATLTCSGEGETWTETATFREDGDTLILMIGDDPPETLHRCASPGS